MIDTFLTQVQAEDTAGDPAGGGFLIIIMFALIGLMIFMAFRRTRKARAEQQKAHEGAVVGAEVVTAGGIVGTIVSRDEENQRVVLEFSNGDRVDFLLAAVQQIATPSPQQRPSSDESE